jgi:hypothetical protein
VKSVDRMRKIVIAIPIRSPRKIAGTIGDPGQMKEVPVSPDGELWMVVEPVLSSM